MSTRSEGSPLENILYLISFIAPHSTSSIEHILTFIPEKVSIFRWAQWRTVHGCADPACVPVSLLAPALQGGPTAWRGGDVTARTLLARPDVSGVLTGFVSAGRTFCKVEVTVTAMTERGAYYGSPHAVPCRSVPGDRCRSRNRCEHHRSSWPRRHSRPRPPHTWHRTGNFLGRGKHFHRGLCVEHDEQELQIPRKNQR